MYVVSLWTTSVALAEAHFFREEYRSTSNSDRFPSDTYPALKYVWIHVSRTGALQCVTVAR